MCLPVTEKMKLRIQFHRSLIRADDLMWTLH